MAAAAIRTILFSLALLPLCGSAGAQEGPRRIASLSLCSDELVLLLADRADIASVSYLAADAEFSSVAEQARGLPLNRGRAEEIVALDPDLILSSQFSASATVSLLRRLGHDVEVLGFPATLDESYAQIRRVAALLGRPARGEALVARMQARIAAAREALSGLAGKTAVFYASNGYSYGSGTLRDALLQDIGWRNVAAEAGLSGPGLLPLESLLSRRPDYLLVNGDPAREAPLAQSLLRHPALRRSFAAGQVLELPDRLFQCAGPSLAAAWTRLAGEVSGMASAPAAGAGAGPAREPTP